MTVQCVIRKSPVAATPEEIVRQGLLRRMIDTLKYPAELLAVEKELSQLPHLQLSSQSLPERRADILCFAKGIHPDFDLYPLLLIECKAHPLNKKVISQVTGYNHYVKAPFFAIANAEEVKTGWYDPARKACQFVPYLPTFNQLTMARENERKQGC